MLTDLTYLAYPLPEDIERLVYTGDLSRALRVIEMRLANDKVPQALKNRLRFEERIIREIPLSYNVSEGEMLVQLQSAFRDFTKEDMERLRDEGTLDWVMIDGSVFYKDNALSSAVKTRPDLHARLLDPHALDESNANAQLLDRRHRPYEARRPYAHPLQNAHDAHHRAARAAPRSAHPCLYARAAQGRAVHAGFHCHRAGSNQDQRRGSPAAHRLF